MRLEFKSRGVTLVVAQPRLQNVPVGVVAGRVGGSLTQFAEAVGDLPLAEELGDRLTVFPAVAEELRLVEVGEFLVAVDA